MDVSANDLALLKKDLENASECTARAAALVGRIIANRDQLPLKLDWKNEPALRLVGEAREKVAGLAARPNGKCPDCGKPSLPISPYCANCIDDPGPR